MMGITPSPAEIDAMVDLGVALTWIAISAASARGLSAFARATARGGDEQEPVPAGVDGAVAHARPYPMDFPPHLLRKCQ
jgi:hypothetical protein